MSTEYSLRFPYAFPVVQRRNDFAFRDEVIAAVGVPDDLILVGSAFVHLDRVTQAAFAQLSFAPITDMSEDVYHTTS